MVDQGSDPHGRGVSCHHLTYQEFLGMLELVTDGGSQLPIVACYLVYVWHFSRSAAFLRKRPNLANTYFVSHPTESVQHKENLITPPPLNCVSLTCETKLTVA